MKNIQKNFYFTLLLLCILPYNYSAMFLNSFSNVITIITYVVRCILIIHVACYIKNLKLSTEEKDVLKKVSLYFVFIFILNIFSTFLGNYSSISDLITRMFSMLYMYVFYVYMIYNYKHIDVFNNILKKVLTVLLIASIVLYIRFPEVGQTYEGYGSYALIGVAANRNSFYELMVPLIVSILFLNDSKKMKFTDKILILAVVVTVILTKSVTSIISLIAFFIILFLQKFKNLNVIKYITYILIIVWIGYLIIVGMDIDLGTFSSFFSKKSTTLTGRTIIWQKALYYFEKNPIIGYGYDNTIIGDTDNYYQLNSIFPNDTHNSILFMLLSSGLIGTISLVYFLISTLIKGIKIIKYDNKYAYIMAYLLSMLVRGLAESCFHYSHLIFFLYLIFINIKYREMCLKDELL